VFPLSGDICDKLKEVIDLDKWNNFCVKQPVSGDASLRRQAAINIYAVYESLVYTTPVNT